MRNADDLEVDLERRAVGTAARGLEPVVATSETDVASAEIERAWWRTREPPRTGGDGPGARRVLDPAELRARQDRDDTFAITRPVLEQFGEQVDPSQQVLAFFDAEGWMLSVTGSPRTAEWISDIDFCPGTNWREGVGQDGLDAASSLQKLADHSSSGRVVSVRTSWTCAAASILAPRSGGLLGVVAIAGPWTSYTQARLLARVVATAVEERLRSAQALVEQVVEHAFATARDPGEGMFAISRTGRVLAANDMARRRLSFAGRDVPPALCQAVVATLEQPEGEPVREREIDWPGPPTRVKLVASSIHHHGGIVLGALVRVLSPRPPRYRRVARSGSSPDPAPVARYGFDDVLGESDSIQRVVALARLASRNDLPVVLLGESGTGKELFAQAIHAGSARKDAPFIAVNCGCIPSALLEAELFGYEAGTFTGGREDGKAGKFEEASGGTLLLDEVNELPPQAQTALLRVLQEHEVVRLGGSTPRPVDVRVIAASGRSLAREIEAGRFRSDLYYRLNVLGIEVPPLRERRSDIELLARSFLAVAEGVVTRPGLAFADDALRALTAYDWPGNVRELRNVVLRAAATAPSTQIVVKDLPTEIRAAAARALPTERIAGAPVPPVVEHDRETLLRMLDACSWNVARAAQTLHVSRMTLYRWLRKFGIER